LARLERNGFETRLKEGARACNREAARVQGKPEALGLGNAGSERTALQRAFAW